VKKTPLSTDLRINITAALAACAGGDLTANCSRLSQNPAADVTALEAEIDRLVYALYGLTAAEIQIVEGGK
jgi:hypothetical protein